MPGMLPSLRLRRNSRARCLSGHPWVFVGELEKPPAAASPGDEATLLDSGGNFVGRGFLSPGPLVLRLLTRNPVEAIDAGFFARRIAAANALRIRLLPGEEALRLVASEADGLPGLVVDRYGSHGVLQVTTAGMDRRLGEISEALKTEAGVTSVLARNDLASREREGLERGVAQLSGTTPAEIPVVLAGLKLLVDPWKGQKTGLYLDQRDLYGLLQGRCSGRRILDMFCYQGVWTLRALREGAVEAIGVDGSGPALQRARHNAGANGLDPILEEANAFEWMREASDRGERFGGIVLDPPPFVKAKEDLEKGLGAYKELSLRAMKMLEPGGWLFVASCSQRVSLEALLELLRQAAADAGRGMRVLKETGQPADHPVLLEIPETRYLKGVLLETQA